MTKPIPTFTDPLAAIDEAQFLADNSGAPYGLYRQGDNIVVMPLNRKLKNLIETVKPTHRWEK